MACRLISGASGSGGKEPAHWWTLVAACVTTFALMVNVTLVTIGLPEIRSGLDATFAEARWVVAAYATAVAGFLLGGGVVADRLGHRRVFLGALAFFLLGSVASGLATSPTFLIVTRAAQGAAAALLLPTSHALIGQAYTGADRGRALGLWAATVGAGTSLGPLLGGVIVDLASWRWLFFVNVPIVVFAAAVTATRVRVGLAGTGGSLDWPGQVTLAGGLLLAVFALSEGEARGWGSPLLVTALAGAPVLLGAFAWSQHARDDAMFDLGLLRMPTVLGASAAVFSLHASFIGLQLFFAVYLQTILGYSPVEAGMILMIPAVMSGIVGPYAGALTARVGARPLVAIGLAGVGIGLFTLRDLGAASHWQDLVAGFLIAGVGYGIANPAIVTSALGTLEAARGGMASGLNFTFRQVGTAIGIALLGAAFDPVARETAVETIAAGASEPAPATIQAAELAGVGNFSDAAQLVPPEAASLVAVAGRAGFVAGLHDIIVIAALLAMAGALAAAVLIREGFPARATAAGDDRRGGGGGRSAPGDEREHPAGAAGPADEP